MNREGLIKDSPAASVDDTVLLVAIAGGDQGAMRTFYDRHSDLAFTLIRRIVGTSGDAEQVLLDVFFELWRRAGDFDRARGSARGYLITLARSRALDSLRRRAKSATASMQDSDVLPAVAASPLEHSIDTEQALLVRSALADLEDDQRRAIEFAYYGGLTHSEIALRLGQPLGTVKTRIRLGLCRLRDRLRRLGSSETES